RCAGRVEVKRQGQWGTVCDDSWDMKDAAVVCRQLGCGSALEAHSNAHFGPGSGPIWMQIVQCDGSESALSDCRSIRNPFRRCGHHEDAGVNCSDRRSLVAGYPSGLACSSRGCRSTKPLFASFSLPDFTEYRLVNGSTTCEGRVEFYVQGTWGSLCDSHWDLLDAHVLCHHLNCG
ncbi:DMBT1 protein, partial [Eubucco bourcierii]|nr:DMBT1 protein [Eubucco bourcierii]